MKKFVKWLVASCLFVAFLYWNNYWLVLTEYTYADERVPKAFDQFRIVQVSDLHDAEFGAGNERLVRFVREAEPDVIFITGDVVDSNRYDLAQSMKAVRRLVEIADVYYVLGNHEVATNDVRTIYEAMQAAGVHILPNASTILERQGEKIVVAGIEDPLMNKGTASMVEKALDGISDEFFTVLLAHRPEQVDVYAEHKADLVFSGHAHGGQFRILGLGGLIAPGQGWLPKYTAGMYKRAETTLVVSRGLGNSLVPQRLGNLPEVVVVELKRGLSRK